MSKVRVRAKTDFEDKGILFSSKTFLFGEQKGDTITFEKGQASGNKHEIPALSFYVQNVEEIPDVDPAQEIRKLRKVFVTPKENFTDKKIGFSSQEQYEGYFSPSTRTIEFLSTNDGGKLSKYSHSIPFEKFQENLDALYTPDTKPGKPQPE